MKPDWRFALHDSTHVPFVLCVDAGRLQGESISLQSMLPSVLLIGTFSIHLELDGIFCCSLFAR